MGVSSINKENNTDVSTVSGLCTPSRKAGAAVLSGPQRVLVPTKTPIAKPVTPKVKNHFMATTVAYRYVLLCCCLSDRSPLLHLNKVPSGAPRAPFTPPLYASPTEMAATPHRSGKAKARRTRV